MANTWKKALKDANLPKKISRNAGKATRFNKSRVNVSSEVMEIAKKPPPPNGDACITSPRN